MNAFRPYKIIFYVQFFVESSFLKYRQKFKTKQKNSKGNKKNSKINKKKSLKRFRKFTIISNKE